MQITLRYIVLSCLEPFKVSGKEYSLALAAGLRFNNECLRFLIIKLRFKILGILGQQPCFGKEVEITGACLFYSHQVFSEQIFASQCIHAWKVICTLVQLHL